MASEEVRNITPTYQGLLLKALSDIWTLSLHMESNSPLNYWHAVRQFICELCPVEITKVVREDVAEIDGMINDVLKYTEGADIYMTRLAKRRAINRICRTHTNPMMERVKALLQKHGYLTRPEHRVTSNHFKRFEEEEE